MSSGEVSKNPAVSIAGVAAVLVVVYFLIAPIVLGALSRTYGGLQNIPVSVMKQIDVPLSSAEWLFEHSDFYQAIFQFEFDLIGE